MKINIVKLNANKRDSDIVEKLNKNLSFNNISLNENVKDSPFTIFFILSGGIEGDFKQLMNKLFISILYCFLKRK